MAQENEIEQSKQAEFESFIPTLLMEKIKELSSRAGLSFQWLSINTSPKSLRGWFKFPCGTKLFATFTLDETLLPPLPKHPVGNVEAIYYLHLYGEGEVFGAYKSIDGLVSVIVSFNGQVYEPLYKGFTKIIEWYRCKPFIEYTLLSKDEFKRVYPDKYEAFEKLKGGE